MRVFLRAVRLMAGLGFGRASLVGRGCYANSTLMILVMSMNLASHLKVELGS